jgi:hypothetical protein
LRRVATTFMSKALASLAQAIADAAEADDQ